MPACGFKPIHAAHAAAVADKIVSLY